MSGTDGTSATATQTHPSPITPDRYPTTIYLILTGVRTEWHESDAGQTLTIPEFTLRLDHDSRAAARCSSDPGAGSGLNPVDLVSGPSVLEVAQMMGRQLLMIAKDMKWTDTEFAELSEEAAAAAASASASGDIGSSSSSSSTITAVDGGGSSTTGTNVGPGGGGGGADRGGLLCGGRTLTGLASALRGQRFQGLFDQSWELTCRIMDARGEQLSGEGIDVALTTWREYEEGYWTRRGGARGS